MSVYYYLRVLVSLVAGVEPGAAPEPRGRPALLALVLLGLVLVVLGLHPAPALDLLTSLVPGS